MAKHERPNSPRSGARKSRETPLLPENKAANRRRFSIKASRSIMGMAHNSPRFNADTV